MNKSSFYRIIFRGRSKKQFSKLKSMNRKTYSSVKRILREISSDPIYRAESLNKSNPGYFSRKVSRGDRIVYKIDNMTHTVTVVSLVGHYCDNGGIF